MSKKYQNLVAGNFEGLDIKDPRTRRELFEEMVEDLSGNEEASKRGVTALKNWEKEDGEPSEPSPAFGPPELALSKGVRDKTFPISETSKKLYQEISQKPFPGTGERSQTEINNETLWEGFLASGEQSGKEPKGMEKAFLEENGRATQPQNPIQTWGPSRMIEGLLSQNEKTFIEGFKQTCSMAMDPLKSLLDTLGEDRTEQLSKNLQIQNPAQLLEKTTETLTPNILNSLQKASPAHTLLETISNTQKNFFKFGETLSNAILEDKKSLEEIQNPEFENLFPKKIKNKEPETEDQKKEKEEKKPTGEDILEILAKATSAQTAYKKALKKGLPSKYAGSSAELSEEITNEISKKDSKTVSQAANLALETAKKSKDAAVKIVTKVVMAAAPPPLGQLLAIGIQAANFAVDATIQAHKEKIDQTENPQQPQQEQQEQTNIEQYTQKSPTKKFLAKTKEEFLKKFVPEQIIPATLSKTIEGIKKLDQEKEPPPAANMAIS